MFRQPRTCLSWHQLHPQRVIFSAETWGLSHREAGDDQSCQDSSSSSVPTHILLRLLRCPDCQIHMNIWGVILFPSHVDVIQSVSEQLHCLSSQSGTKFTAEADRKCLIHRGDVRLLEKGITLIDEVGLRSWDRKGGKRETGQSRTEGTKNGAES